VLITPHCGYRSLEAFATLKERTAEIACRFLSGDVPPYVVNKDVLGKLKKQ
jgi:lactate dehydrogenase-like 2-hydroxyacid dehydrogenase